MGIKWTDNPFWRQAFWYIKTLSTIHWYYTMKLLKLLHISLNAKTETDKHLKFLKWCEWCHFEMKLCHSHIKLELAMRSCHALLPTELCFSSWLDAICSPEWTEIALDPPVEILLASGVVLSDWFCKWEMIFRQVSMWGHHQKAQFTLINKMAMYREARRSYSSHFE